MSDKVLRCAIYTRKSHEEGLDQAFNSLDAQREAGEDYVRSQKHQGWSVLKKPYDDGGFSGGTMRRPGLEALLEDIGHGDIDVVVVYKVDRLSRSLGDFARIMQLFEEHEVSFVSVTQQFSTTTSMGRLTLNMLLSFAQFEREVTGERIRDKVAATRKKGMWTGGPPPLGYQPIDRQLVVIPEEAQLVRRIFEGYREDSSLIALARRLNQAGATTKRWQSTKGNWHGGRPLTPQYLYGILNNPLYIGRVVHKERTWPGQHEAVIDQTLWDRVHTTIGKPDAKSRHRWSHPYLLKGKLRTYEGFAMSPGSVHRPTKSGKKRLVRYYVSQKAIKQGYDSCAIKTLNAGRLDELVRALVINQLDADLRARLAEQELLVRDHWIREMIDTVRLAPDRLSVHLDLARIDAARGHEWPSVDDDARPVPPPTCAYRPEVEKHAKHLVLTLSLQIKRLDGKRMLVCPEGHDLVVPSVPEPNEYIVRAIGMAYHCRDVLLKTGKTTAQLAAEIGVSDSRIKKLLYLTNLSPRILRDALVGRLPATVSGLLAASRRLDWNAQAIALGLRAVK